MFKIKSVWLKSRVKLEIVVIALISKHNALRPGLEIVPVHRCPTLVDSNTSVLSYISKLEKINLQAYLSLYSTVHDLVKA